VPFGKLEKFAGVLLMREIGGSALSVSVCGIHENFKLLPPALPEQKDYRFPYENVVCSRESKSYVLHRYSKCCGQSQPQNVVAELFQASGFDVEDSTVYKQWSCDGLQKLYPRQVLLEDFLKRDAE
jgi:hypothetical protein